MFFDHQNCCYLGDLDAGKAAMSDNAGAFSRLAANAAVKPPCPLLDTTCIELAAQ